MTQRSRKKGNIEIWLHSQPAVCHAHFVLGIYQKPLEIEFKIFICRWNLEKLECTRTISVFYF